jgi:hypothetical protein
MSKRKKVSDDTESAAAKTAYRKIEVGLWHDERFLAFTKPQPNGQTLWIYLLCGPRTTVLPGLVVAREAVIADDLGWSLDGTRDAIRDVTQHGIVDADWMAGVVVLRKALFDSLGRPRDTSKPQSVGQLKSWAKAFKYIRECPLKYEYLHRLSAMADAMGSAWSSAFRDAFRDAISKASPIHKTENIEQKTCRGGEQPAPVQPPVIAPAYGFSSPRAKLIHDAWSLAAKTHLALRQDVEPTARPWPGLPVGQGAEDLSQRVDELTSVVTDDTEYPQATIAHVVAVRAAEAQRLRHLGFFIPTRLWAKQSFWKASEQSVEQAVLSADKQANKTDERPVVEEL